MNIDSLSSNLVNFTYWYRSSHEDSRGFLWLDCRTFDLWAQVKFITFLFETSSKWTLVLVFYIHFFHVLVKVNFFICFKILTWFPHLFFTILESFTSCVVRAPYFLSTLCLSLMVYLCSQFVICLLISFMLFHHYEYL